ncbi:MAG: ABC transporter ATP-binding protein [Chlamydiales bacterium]|nr:ABC transporter ATP-binding protein [Chlamydiales bacterium]
MSSEPVVIAQDLCFAYGTAPVLTNVSFQIMPGEFVGIIGPNGGGKTTLLKLMLGFLKPSSGSLKIFDKAPNDAHYDVAYVPQRLPFDRLFPISVMEVVLTGRLATLPWYGAYSNEDLRLAKESLDLVELSDFSEAPFGSLSGGQAQRVLIARALVSQPKLLLLDEPTSSVDVEAQADIYNLLDKLRGKMTIAMVTHDLGTVIERVERVLCVQGVAIPLKPEEVCEHFTMGLYHTPLIMPGRKDV